MHGCILSYERERDSSKKIFSYRIAIIYSWLHIPNYAYKKKKKSERAVPSILPYIQKIYSKIRMSWVMLHLYIDRVPTFFFLKFFKEKLESSQHYLIYGNLI